ncbi:helix-turn-helix domain-containing protein [Streptomyces pseudovenezuelae]|uniref:helix-turn-helix domain-containing protein n=1 Tax=Streptomyces pseudovenezuelae TaxID=67350 RepID=UPI0036E86E32
MVLDAGVSGVLVDGLCGAAPVEHQVVERRAVADRLGFSSATHFNKYFHQRTGQTPIAFRDTVRGRSPS